MIRFLYKLLPERSKRQLFAVVNQERKAKRHKESETLPYTELTEAHIKNLKVLVNRETLLKQLPSGGIVAELGVDKGAFSEKILSLCTPSKFHLVDTWGTKRYHEGLMQDVRQRFQDPIKRDVIEINRGYSTEVGKNFPDHYFDWIYIDTNHSYKTTKEELEIYAPKIKEGGLIAGHDFVVWNWKNDVRYGVIEAVYEFCVKHRWEWVYLTTELYAPSFGLRKMP